MKCRICSYETRLFSQATVLRKYSVQYFRCPHCGFVQTEEPYWLDEAYAAPIGAVDIGLLQRNLVVGRTAKAMIGLLFDPNGRFLDYGGGYGVLVRLMRDQGFDFYRHDKYCANLFAEGFDDSAEPECDQKYELVTAFEVFEHLAEPITDVARILNFSPNVLFTTNLLPPAAPRPSDWWYYSLDSGQHVALYTRRSLELIARHFGLNLYSNGISIHLMTKRRISPIIFNLLSKYKIAALAGSLVRRRSLLASDAERVLGQVIQ
jgi:hypothetical protein